MSRSRSIIALVPCCVLAAGLLAAGGAQAAFPGTNGKIAFVRDSGASGSSRDIWTMDPTGENRTQLTGTTDDDEEPSYSADGERIVFVRRLPGNIRQIWVMNHDGSGQTQLTDGGASGNDSHPSFSPDGQKIAFIRYLPSTDNQLWLMNADGSEQAQLTFPGPSGDDVDFAAFSPDGQRIVIERDDGAGGFRGIAVINADGSGLQTLTTTGEREPDYSPDGQRIVFERSYDTWVMNADGSGQTQVTEAGSSFDFNAVFSPDGTRIAFHREPPSGSPGDLLLADPSALDQITPLTSNTGDEYDFEPSWQPLNPPSCQLAGRPKQKSVKSVAVTVTCAGENATVVAEGSGKAPKVPKSGAVASKKKQFTIPAVTAQVPAATSTTLTLAIPKKGRKALKKATKAGKKGKATITATSTDDLGQTSTESFTVKFKAKKKKK